MYNEETNTLIHAGKKGMKWGVRKDRRSSDAKAIAPLRKKSASTLSNDDIKKVVTRMQLEKQYKDINPRGVNKGLRGIKATVDGFSAGEKTIITAVALAGSAKAAAAWVNTPAGQAVKNSIVSKISKLTN